MLVQTVLMLKEKRGESTSLSQKDISCWHILLTELNFSQNTKAEHKKCYC